MHFAVASCSILLVASKLTGGFRMGVSVSRREFNNAHTHTREAVSVWLSSPLPFQRGQLFGWLMFGPQVESISASTKLYEWHAHIHTVYVKPFERETLTANRKLLHILYMLGDEDFGCATAGLIRAPGNVKDHWSDGCDRLVVYMLYTTLHPHIPFSLLPLLYESKLLSKKK